MIKWWKRFFWDQFRSDRQFRFWVLSCSFFSALESVAIWMWVTR